MCPPAPMTSMFAILGPTLTGFCCGLVSCDGHLKGVVEVVAVAKLTIGARADQRDFASDACVAIRVIPRVTEHVFEIRSVPDLASRELAQRSWKTIQVGGERLDRDLEVAHLTACEADLVRPTGSRRESISQGKGNGSAGGEQKERICPANHGSCALPTR